MQPYSHFTTPPADLHGAVLHRQPVTPLLDRLMHITRQILYIDGGYMAAL
jgi:hypothetical protein